ncbi:MAG: Asp-tRNA(Asn)/Glu-tRNA(Gln) amidotransferase subunit GatC [bacterium]
MIDREQVRHVARLARLSLSEEEEVRITEQLSGILEHVEKISALDLEGVEPTTHVIELTNRFRPDVPVEAPPREILLEAAPEGGADSAGFEVPSPQA